MIRDVSNLRKSYTKNFLDERDLPHQPLNLFDKWFKEAISNKSKNEINAMTLSTIDNFGYPNGRIVLLKYYSIDGFIFFTNYNSKKSLSIKNNNKVSISFFWEEMERQVIIKGNAYKTSEDLSDQYFNSRPKGSKLGALVSKNQSSVIESKKVLIQRFNQLSNEFKSKSIERPKNWGGYIIKPIEYEFWQGGPDRLHDRIRYRNNVKNWIIERLSP